MLIFGLDDVDTYHSAIPRLDGKRIKNRFWRSGSKFGIGCNKFDIFFFFK
jgi:hypothetical protein